MKGEAMTTIAELPPGFADKVLSAQSTFRSVMDAMARPGTVQRIVPMAGTAGPMMRGTAAIALTLFDHDTPLWLDARMAESADVLKWLKFHTGAPVIQDSSIAAFALISDGMLLPNLERFALGTNEYPDRSTTVIIQVESLDSGRNFELRGPGIDGVATLAASFKPFDLFEQLRFNETLFPRGIDLVLVADDAVVAIPRTTRVMSKGG
ncbi:phosphonate C-P lyase system protein PhnH [Bradyrhizobium guangzhouense]|uniref:Phosphonate C-P lyase system protein PhnH n=2 Tax=Bradyrhizobium guangzhouense TaxID=1325095 RepID=A0AAE6C6W5_9BRAD|nr:phosphonate C-P lyase system protein PhnH [Bradyrhizobium guangzhouense]RXH13894.1 phosphonate C-P lyase system protein PhnH [Bradyrhizobium guangzhouense]RXH16711.1 phosphonate C-P lyase system protein PhnH [Bradyrhizobium guangzhouense]